MSLSLDEIIRTAQIIIASVGGTSIVIIGLATWLGKIWSDKIYIHTSTKYEKEIEEVKQRYSADLEHLRSEIAERRDLLNSTQSMLSVSFIASHERILKSVESLWNNVGEIRTFSIGFHSLYNLFAPGHYENIPVDRFEKLIPVITSTELFEKFASLHKDVESNRLFVGEKLWSLYQVYYGFTLKIAWKVIEGKEQGKFFSWDKDSDGQRDNNLFEYLRGAFTDDELNIIIESNPQNGVPERVMNSLEVKMLNEMNELIFGRRLVSMSIEQQQRVTSLLNSISSKAGRSVD